MNTIKSDVVWNMKEINTQLGEFYGVTIDKYDVMSGKADMSNGEVLYAKDIMDMVRLQK